MNIHVTVHLSDALEKRIRAENPDLPAAVRESFVVDLVRRGILDRHELSQALGLDRFETLALLKRHGVFEGSLSSEDIATDIESIEDLIGPGRK